MPAEILSDKGTHYWVKTAPVRPGGPPRRLKIRRSLCIGGPHAGAWRSAEELMEEKLWKDYHPFNNGGVSRHSQVFIHKELLP